MTFIFSMILWFGCSNSSDPKPVVRDVTNASVAEQAEKESLQMMVTASLSTSLRQVVAF